MILPDVNVLVYACRRDSPEHEAYRRWLDGVVNGDSAFGVAELVLSAVVRLVTNRRIFHEPSTTASALDFTASLRNRPNCTPIRSGSGHWDIFTRLCRETNARGNLVPDAYLAALAIESGCEWITTDRDFARFQGLRWRHPLAS